MNRIDMLAKRNAIYLMRTNGFDYLWIARAVGLPMARCQQLYSAMRRLIKRQRHV